MPRSSSVIADSTAASSSSSPRMCSETPFISSIISDASAPSRFRRATLSEASLRRRFSSSTSTRIDRRFSSAASRESSPSVDSPLRTSESLTTSGFERTNFRSSMSNTPHFVWSSWRFQNQKTRPSRRSPPGAGETSRVATPIGRLDKHPRFFTTTRLFSGVPTRCRCHGRTRHGLLLFGRPLQGGFTCLHSPVHTRILRRPPPVRRFRSSGRRAHPAL